MAARPATPHAATIERTSSEPKARGAALWTAVGMMEELVPELWTVEFALTAAEEPDEDGTGALDVGAGGAERKQSREPL